jgi:2-dehydropantoate 2-reductase
MSSSKAVSTAGEQEGKSPIKVLVIGFGALGGLYSWILSKGGAQIYAVARSNAQSLRQDGIRIESEAYGIEPSFKPYKVFSSPEEIAECEPYDYVLCTMKIVPEEEPTGQLLHKMLKGKGIHSSLLRSQKPTIVFVENGIGIEEEPYETLCKGEGAIAGTIISCCAWLGANLIQGGKVVSHGNFERLEMGLYPAPNEAEKEELAWQKEKLRTFSETYTRGGGKAMLIEEDIQPNRWKKILWNAAWGGLSKLARQPVSVLLEDENLSYSASVCRKIMLE